MLKFTNKDILLKEITDDSTFRFECVSELLKDINSFDSNTEFLATESHFKNIDSNIFAKLVALLTSYKLTNKRLTKEATLQNNEITRQESLLNNKTNKVNSMNSKLIDIKNNTLIETKKQNTIIGNLKSEIADLKSKYDYIVRKNRSLNTKEELLIKQNGLKEKTIYKLKTLKFNNRNKNHKRNNGCEGFTIITLNENEHLYIKDRIANTSMTINNLDNNDLLNEEVIPTKKRKTESRHLNVRLNTEDSNNSIILNQKEGIDVYQIVNNYEEEIRIYKDSINDIKLRFDRVIEELNYLFKEFVNTSENADKILVDFESHLFEINRINLEVFEEGLKQHVLKYKNIINGYGNYKKDRIERVENNYKYLTEICSVLINAIYKTNIDKSVTKDEFIIKEINNIHKKDLEIKELKEWFENQYESE